MSKLTNIFSRAAALGLVGGLLAGCYSSAIDTVPPTTGVRIPSLSDGVYASNDKDYELRWRRDEREYAIEAFEDGRWQGTYRIAAKYLGKRHWLLRGRAIRDKKGPVHAIKIANLVGRMRGRDLALLEPGDDDIANELAEKHDVDIEPTGPFGPRIESDNAEAIYAFLHDLVGSRTLRRAQTFELTEYLDAPSTRRRHSGRWRGPGRRDGWTRVRDPYRVTPRPLPGKRPTPLPRPAPTKPAPKKPVLPKKPWQCDANDILKETPGCG